MQIWNSCAGQVPKKRSAAITNVYPRRTDARAESVLDDSDFCLGTCFVCHTDLHDTEHETNASARIACECYPYATVHVRCLTDTIVCARDNEQPLQCPCCGVVCAVQTRCGDGGGGGLLVWCVATALCFTIKLRDTALFLWAVCVVATSDFSKITEVCIATYFCIEWLFFISRSKRNGNDEKYGQRDATVPTVAVVIKRHLSALLSLRRVVLSCMLLFARRVFVILRHRCALYTAQMCHFATIAVMDDHGRGERTWPPHGQRRHRDYDAVDAMRWTRSPRCPVADFVDWMSSAQYHTQHSSTSCAIPLLTFHILFEHQIKIYVIVLAQFFICILQSIENSWAKSFGQIKFLRI